MLILNVDKIKEILLDFRKDRASHAPLLNQNTAVEVVKGRRSQTDSPGL